MTDTKTRKAIFHTGTTIDPTSWEMLGISAKMKDNAVGCFGTGLSYAVAVLLRLGHGVTIKTEADEYVFGIEDMDFRGKAFQCVTCNGKRLSFTTEYGKNWSCANAYRELVSNTMDEDGIWMIAEDAMDHGTSVIIEGDEIVGCMEKHEDYFVGERKPIAETSGMNYYQGSGTIFYRGVKVGTVENAKYSYEIKGHLSLTEDRTILNSYHVPQKIGEDITKNLTDKALIRRFVTAAPGTFESKLDYDWTWSKDFEEVARDVWEKAPTKLVTSIAVLLRRRMPDVGWKKLEPNEDQQIYIDKATGLLSKFGYPITAPIKLINNDDQLVIAFVHEKQIYLTQRAFDKGLFYLMTTLLEEHLHTEGFQDYSRTFQDYLLDELVKHAAKRFKEPI